MDIAESIPEGSALIVGVSGGVDSVVLFHALSTLVSSRSLTLFVAHIDHGIRDASSHDADFVKSLCESYAIPFFLRTMMPPKRVPDSAVNSYEENVEQWGRRQRYDFFEERRVAVKADFIVTAHTADDQIELYLMRLFSNKPFSAMPMLEPRRQLLRPLIHTRRRQIEQYAAQHGLTWMEDVTNQDNHYLRNRTRNLTIPFLADQYGATITDQLLTRIDNSIEDSDFFEEIVAGHLAKINEHEFGSRAWLRLIVEILKEQHSALRWRICDQLFFEQFHKRLGHPASMRLAHFFMSNSPSLQLPYNHTIRRAGGGITFTGTVG